MSSCLAKWSLIWKQQCIIEIGVEKKCTDWHSLKLVESLRRPKNGCKHNNQAVANAFQSCVQHRCSHKMKRASTSTSVWNWLMKKMNYTDNILLTSSLLWRSLSVTSVGARRPFGGDCYIVIYTFIQHHNDTIIKTHEGRKTQEELRCRKEDTRRLL